MKLNIYNVLGQQVRMLVDQLQVPGSYLVSWDGFLLCEYCSPSHTVLPLPHLPHPVIQLVEPAVNPPQLDQLLVPAPLAHLAVV